MSVSTLAKSVPIAGASIAVSVIAAALKVKADAAARLAIFDANCEAATKLYKEKKYDEAIQRYTAAIDACAPDDANNKKILLHNRAAAHEKVNATDNVITDCTAALQLDGRYHKALNRRAKAYKSQGKSRPALHDLTTAWLLETIVWQSKAQSMALEYQRKGGELSSLPETLERQTRMQELQMTYEQVMTDLQAQQEAAAQPAQIDALLKTIGAEDAKAHFADPANKKKGLPSVSFITAYLNAFQHSEYDSTIDPTERQSLETLLATVEAEPNNGVVAYACGLACKAAQRYAEAFDYFRKACELLPASAALLPAALNELGTFLHLYGDLDAAKAALQRSVALRVDVVNTWVKLAGLCFDRDERPEALEFFDTALRVDEAAADVYFHRGLMHMITDNFADAIADFERCLQEEPSFALAHMQMGIVFFRQDNMESALTSLKLATELAPTLPEVHNFYGEVLLNLSKNDEALATFDRAIEVDASVPIHYVNKGLLLLQRQSSADDHEAAKALFEKALEVDPQCHHAHLRLAQLALQQQRGGDAIRHYDMAIEWPKHEAELAEMFSFREAAVSQLAVSEYIALLNNNNNNNNNATPC
jgi:import receptor subunit TOM70